jgi:sugar phosphate isomerase/epimerase
MACSVLLSAQSKARVGCQTNAWRIDPASLDSLLGVLERIRHYGYQGYETGFRNLQGHFDNAASTRKALEKYGLEFLGCHIFLLEYDKDTAIAPVELIARVVRGASALGAKRLILSGASVRTTGSLSRKAAALNAAGKLCKQHGLQLAYHNHDKEFLAGAEEMESMLRITDGEFVHLVVDAGHAWLAKADVAAFFRRHSARIDGMHLRDFRNDDQVPLGEGVNDLKPLAAAIAAKAWSGWLVNEEERLNDGRPGDTAVEPARKHVRKIFGV